MNILKDYFRRYPNSQEVFRAEDGILFHTRSGAESYGLDYKRYSREEIFTQNVSNLCDIQTLSYQELKSRVKELNIEVADYKRETLVSALELQSKQ